ncbi:MAG: patatin-like phospholipase family protein [Paludibacteraceae bacterium]|nr:patatin-like phospholipase family protein [Paludibacteraceae bacterium]
MNLLHNKYAKPLFCLLLSSLVSPLSAQETDTVKVDTALVATQTVADTIPTPVQTTPKRLKVGVVLSGGGAKGAAHVSVLKAIEAAGIPIDYIVGTSMGSIVGGLYAYGYSTNQLDSLFRSQDWMNLLLNEVDRNQKDFITRENAEQYMVTIPAFRNSKRHLKGGVLSGEAVLNLFKALTPECADSMDFSDLKIPFACVAVDIVTGKEIDMYSGQLATCIRSSMSIPCVFSPIHYEDMVLVDGGISNNYPVDIAKMMGADVVIGVTLDSETPGYTADDIVSPLDVMSQLMNNITDNKVNDNLQITDLHINVNTEGFSSASFSTEAIETLLQRGAEAAYKHRDELVAFREKLNLPADTVIEPMAGKRVPEEAKDVISNFDYGCTLGAGLRLDNEELAAVLVGGVYKFHSKLRPTVGAQLRLGRRSYGKLNASFKPMRHWTLEGTYKFSYNETKFYSEGKRVLDWDFHEQFARLAFFRTWNYMKVTLAADYAKRNFDHLMSSAGYVLAKGYADATTFDAETNINYYASVRFDNRDTHVFPHKGLNWTARYTFLTDDWTKYHDDNGLSVLELSYEHNVPLLERLTFVPAVWGRFVNTDETLRMGDQNVIGGTYGVGHYLPQQVPFAGVNFFESTGNKFAAFGLTLRGRLGDNHYLYGVGNLGCSSAKIKNFLTKDKLYGAALGYGYKTPIGPAELNFNWSNKTEKVGLWASFGYMF